MMLKVKIILFNKDTLGKPLFGKGASVAWEGIASKANLFLKSLSIKGVLCYNDAP